jgi:hypothetical protein
MEVSCQPHDPDTLLPGKEPRTHSIGGGLGLQSRSGGSGEEMKLLAPARNQTPDRVHIMDYGKGNTIRATSAVGYVNIQITKHYAGKYIQQVDLYAGPTAHLHLFTEIS